MVCYAYRRGRRPVWVFLSLVFLYLGAARAVTEERNWEIRESAALELSGKYTEVSGKITSLEETDKGVKILLKTKASGVLAVMEEDWKKEDLETEPGIGQLVLVKGEAQLFSEVRNPGEFDFKTYYRSVGLDYKIYGEELQILDKRTDPILNGLRHVKLRGEEILYRLTPREDAGIFAAALMGDKTGIPKEINSLYQKNGIAHLLAISGMHMSVIGMSLYRLLRKIGCGYGTAGSGGALLVILYGILTGGSASVERAVIMMTVAFLASYLGRTYDLLSSASFALLILALKSPLFLTQGGVQLSFGAVFAIGAVGPVLERWVGKEIPFAGAISTSIAIQMVTLPVVLYHFYQIPLYGIFLNFLAIPLMDGVIYSASGIIFLGSFSARLGVWAAGIGHYILALYEFLCRNISQIPYYNLIFGRPAAGKIVGYVILLLALLAGLEARGRREEKKETENRKKLENKKENFNAGHKFVHGKRLFLVFVMYGCCILFFRPEPVKGLEALFLDVGQGDGILLRTGAYTILVDGGSSSKKSMGEYTLEPCLKSLGISTIQYAFISHGDIDHISGVSYLLEKSMDIKLKNIMLPCQGRQDQGIQKLEALAKKRGTKVFYLKEGDIIRLGKLHIACLYPGLQDVTEDINEGSEVLKMDYGACHMLFTGDMGELSEEKLLARTGGENLSEVNVLKTAHHGSKYSTGEAFLDGVMPRWAVISYGEGNSYGHPHGEVLERFSERNVEVFKTAEGGAVKLRTDGKSIRFSSFCVKN